MLLKLNISISYLLKLISNIGGLSVLLRINGTSSCFIGSCKNKVLIREEKTAFHYVPL